MGALLPSLGDVVCRVSVRLGTTSMTVRDCLVLDRDGVVLLAQRVGEDVDVHIHGHVIARGEIEIIDNRSSIRLTALAGASGDQVGS